MTKNKPRITNKQLKAIEALMSVSAPKFDLDKIRAAMLEHDRTCGLCRTLGFLPRRGQ